MNDVGKVPFVRMWGLEILIRRPEMNDGATVMRLATEISLSCGLRYAAQAAAEFGQVDWIRGQKETWRNDGSWDRRAIIWASRSLSQGKRRPWIDVAKGCGDPVDRAVAILADSQP